MMGLARNNQHPVWRWLAIVAAGAGMAFAPIGCASPDLSIPTRPAGIEFPLPMVLFGAGPLAEPNVTGKAITYNPELAPVGAGTSRTTVPFTFTDRAPGSIVIHAAMQTATGPGQAGTAGARIACLTLAKR